MTTRKKSPARAIADVASGTILASVEIAAAPDRVFRALTSPEEIVRWWGSEELYKTTSWTSDFKVGGAWRAEGMGSDGRKFAVVGKYLEIDPPKKIVQTWQPDFDDNQVTTITYLLEPIEQGTRVVLRHEGFAARADSCRGHGVGWERVLDWLSGFVAPPSAAAADRYFLCRLLPPRPTFAMDMNEEERAVMGAHAMYWRAAMEAGNVVVFGPVGDPQGPWGLGVVKAADEAAVRAWTEKDPAILSGRGFKTEILPMLQAVLPS
jgi:uncharacterized protein YndB with AHSA1/START domain/uncharacterized protein YciI